MYEVCLPGIETLLYISQLVVCFIQAWTTLLQLEVCLCFEFVGKLVINYFGLFIMEM